MALVSRIVATIMLIGMVTALAAVATETTPAAPVPETRPVEAAASPGTPDPVRIATEALLDK